MAMNDLAQLNEELRKDELQALWTRFGPVLLVAIVILIIGSAIWAGVSAWQRGQREDATAQLAAILEKPSAQRAGDLAALEKTPVAVSARLTQIGDALEAGQTAEAKKHIAALMADKGAPDFYRQMAVILDARLSLDGEPKDSAAALSRLKPLAQDVDTPWGPQAIFYKAVIEMRAADDIKEIRRIADEAGKKLAADQALLRQLTSLENLYLADRPVE